MVSYCETALPYEGCGLLSGKGGPGETLWKMENESKRMNRFHMSAQSIKEVVEKMAEKGEELTGIFHSHPNSPPIPSAADIQNNPYHDLAYIIVSFYKDEPNVGCYKISSSGEVFPLQLNIIDK